MAAENDEWKKLVAEQLSNLIGSRVVGVRVGDNGFDLVFDNGRELEVYILTVSDEKSGVKRCYWGITVPKYVWFRAKGAEEAKRAAEILSKRSIDASVVGPLQDGSIYVGINEHMVEEFKKICEEDDELKKLVSC